MDYLLGSLAPAHITRKMASLEAYLFCYDEYMQQDIEVDQLAKKVWEYSHLHQRLEKADAIFCLCSLDTRVAERSAQLLLDGLGDYLIFSGNSGELTKDIFDKPEAEVFADIAMRMGVPPEKILIENKSTNTGENVQFTSQLLVEKGLSPASLILVQKPYMERRTYATFKKQWPNPETKIFVTSPQIEYDDYFTPEIPKDLVINIMVGDLQRIREYPKLGFQIEQDIPDDVWQANEKLISLGYDQHLIH